MTSALQIPRRTLGRTCLRVSSVGLGGGHQISRDATLAAFARGINFFFYSSDLHHYKYSAMGDALRGLCHRASSVRENVVLATVTYGLHPKLLPSVLYDQIDDLRTDYIDVFFWGWIDGQDGAALDSCVTLSDNFRGPDARWTAHLEQLFEVSERAKRLGVIRYLGASFHDLGLAREWLHSGALDVVMVRHNPAHRTAQDTIFHHADTEPTNRPGIVVFNSIMARSRSLLLAPRELPHDAWLPDAATLYRYNLEQSGVDICLGGCANESELDALVAAATQPRLPHAIVRHLEAYGDLHRGRRLNELSSDALLTPERAAALLSESCLVLENT